MNPINIMAVLFGILMGLLDLVVLTGFQTGYDTPLMVFLGLATGQLALLALWCVLGKRWPIVRLLAVLTAAGFLSHPMGAVTGGNWPQWFTLFCLFAASTAGSIALARFFGLRAAIGRAAADEGIRLPTQQSVRRPRQFSLGGLLSAMTVVGIALGLGRHFAFPHEQALAVAIYGFWLILIGTTTLWTLVGRRMLPARLLGLAGLCTVAGWFMARAEPQPGMWFFTNVAFIEAIVICMGITIIEGNWIANPQGSP